MLSNFQLYNLIHRRLNQSILQLVFPYWKLIMFSQKNKIDKKKKKRIDGNYTRMLRAVLNKSWRQHPTRHQLYGHLPPPHITKTIQFRRTRHAGHCWRSKDKRKSDVILLTPTYGHAKAGRPARTYIQLCEDTGCNPEDLPGAMNDRSGERGSGISVLVARHDDDDRQKLSWTDKMAPGMKAGVPLNSSTCEDYNHWSIRFRRVVRDVRGNHRRWTTYAKFSFTTSEIQSDTLPWLKSLGPQNKGSSLSLIKTDSQCWWIYRKKIFHRWKLSFHNTDIVFCISFVFSLEYEEFSSEQCVCVYIYLS